MTNYKDILNTMSGKLTSIQKKNADKARRAEASQISTPKVDITSALLNKIGLEVQRQGGH